MTEIGFLQNRKTISNWNKQRGWRLLEQTDWPKRSFLVLGSSDLHFSLKLLLLWVVRVVDRTVVTELASRNNGFAPGERSQLALSQSG